LIHERVNLFIHFGDAAGEGVAAVNFVGVVALDSGRITAKDVSES